MTYYNDDHLDGNAAAGELSNLFAVDVTAAEGQCSHCGAVRPFAQALVYMGGPGLVARCAACENVLLRMVNAQRRVLLDLRGMAYLSVDVG
jgi:Family of unknown function (DUF6510)